MRQHVVATLGFLFFAVPQLWADALLLHNGNSIQGAINRSRGDYIVRTAKGSTIHVPKSKVQLHAKSLDDIFRWKLRRTGNTDVKAQVKLANWCIQEGLKQNAVDRLLHVSRLAPNDSAVRALERQMRSQIRPKSRVVQAIALEPLFDSRKNKPSIELKGDSVAEFRRVIQPLLINRCGQASCHGVAAKSDFQLVRFRNLRPNRQLTLKNLDVTTTFMSTANPPESQLLKNAREIHGNQKRLAFEARDIDRYRRLEKWVYNILDYEPTQELSLDSSPAGDNQLDKNAVKSTDSKNTSVSQGLPGTPGAPFRKDIRTVPPVQVERPSKKPITDRSPDPFDPQGFNQQFGSNSGK